MGSTDQRGEAGCRRESAQVELSSAPCESLRAGESAACSAVETVTDSVSSHETGVIETLSLSFKRIALARRCVLQARARDPHAIKRS